MSGLPDLHVGIAQIAPELMDIEANVEKHIDYIRKAEKEGVELLVFPELSLTGYHFDETFPDIAISAKDNVLTRIAQAAPEMRVIVGFVEESNASLLYNSAAVLQHGKVAFIHRKVNLPTYGDLVEDKWFSEGRTINTFEVADWQAGLLLCADMWNPGLVNLLALQGAKMLIAPINSANDSVKFDNPSNWRRTVSFYSFMYGMPIILANRVGEEGGRRFWGGSCIYDPYGNVIVSSETDEEELITGVIRWAQVKRARFDLPTLRDANFSLMLREMRRLDQLLT